MQIYKTYKYRIYPNKAQTILINKTIGCTRFIFNTLLAEWRSCFAREKHGLSQLKCLEIATQLKQNEKTSWLNEVDALALDYAAKQLFKAYIGYFRKERQEPTFKRKLAIKQNYHTRNVDNCIEMIGGRIKLPIVGLVRKRDKRFIQGRIISATISKTSSNRYYAALLVAENAVELPSMGSSIGLDLGLKYFAVLSNGKKIGNYKFLYTYAEKLAKAQKILSRRALLAKKAGKKLLDCMNYQKQRIKVAKIYEKIANKRHHFLHKISREIIKNHDIICVEDLASKQLMQNRSLAKSIADAAWNEFVIMLEYKARWYGKRLIKVSRWLPSTQLCSHCNYRSNKKGLKIRSWTCRMCGTMHDRDVNASINILKAGLKIA